MAKRTDTPLAKRVEGLDPALLMKYAQADTSLDALNEYRILPRLKLVQGLSDQALKDKFGEGAAIIRPGDALVAKFKTPFMFVPQFFFAEFAQWADRKDKESRMVIERTFDPTHEIAKKARDAKTRFELYPDQEKKKEADRWKYRFVEHLRFPGVVYGDHPLSGTPTVVSFERGEFMNGKNFISAIALRRQILEVPDVGPKPFKVPLWMQVWIMTPATHSYNNNKWIGLDYANPSDQEGGDLVDNLIKPEDYEAYSQENADLTELHKANKVRVDDEDADAGDGGEAGTADSGKY